MVDGSIVLVAKCPMPGKSKTRLIPLLGPEGSAALAQAMLSDILQNLTELKISLANAANAPTTVQLILLYAPAEGRSIMEALLSDLNISSVHWNLMPMLSSSSSLDDNVGDAQKKNSDLQSSNLGAKLTDALIRARQLQLEQFPLRHQQQLNAVGPVVFLGMDSPETPLDEIAAVFANAKNDNAHNEEYESLSLTSFAPSDSPSTAILCPAEDGGYGMLSVPPHLPAAQVFAGVRWSQALTAMSQLKALTDIIIANNHHGKTATPLGVRIGRLMYDIDEPADVHALVKRLQSKGRGATSDDKHHPNQHHDNLLRSSVIPGGERTSDCPRTRQILIEYGFMEEKA